MPDSSNQIGSQAVNQLPLGHISTIIHKVKGETEREYYIQQTIEQAWPRETLERNIVQKPYSRQATPTEKNPIT